MTRVSGQGSGPLEPLQPAAEGEENDPVPNSFSNRPAALGPLSPIGPRPAVDGTEDGSASNSVSNSNQTRPLAPLPSPRSTSAPDVTSRDGTQALEAVRALLPELREAGLTTARIVAIASNNRDTQAPEGGALQELRDGMTPKDAAQEYGITHPDHT